MIFDKPCNPCPKEDTIRCSDCIRGESMNLRERIDEKYYEDIIASVKKTQIKPTDWELAEKLIKDLIHVDERLKRIAILETIKEAQTHCCAVCGNKLEKMKEWQGFELQNTEPKNTDTPMRRYTEFEAHEKTWKKETTHDMFPKNK